MKVKKLPDSYHQRVLGYPSTPISPKQQRAMLATWEAMKLTEATDGNEVSEIPMPSWFGNYQSHLEEAVARYGSEYIKLAKRFAGMETPELPPDPPYVPGWIRCPLDGDRWLPSEAPTDPVMVLDFETVRVKDDASHEEEACNESESDEDLPVQNGNWRPVCMVMLSEASWYVWTADIHQELPRTVDLPRDQRLLIGHNVQYDRAWLTPEYLMEPSGSRFLDTMAMWIATRGMCNQQRPVFKITEKGMRPAWADQTSTNGLDAVHRFYFPNEVLDKGVRSLLVGEGLSWVKGNMRSLIAYCLRDVLATFRVYKSLYPEFRRVQPSDVSLTAQLLLGSAWLPLSSDRYPSYFDKAETEFTRAYLEIQHHIQNRFLEIWQHFRTHGLPQILEALDTKGLSKELKDQLIAKVTEGYIETLDVQLQSLDWTPAQGGKNKGLPAWIRNYANLQPDGVLKFKKALRLAHRQVALMLGVQWRGEPIIWSGDGKTGAWTTEAYGRLPHTDKRGKRVTNVFCKGYATHVDTGTLTASTDVGGMLAGALSCINWVSLRKRVDAIKVESPEGFPVTLPQLVVTGTVTRRAADNLWQVASNPKAKRIGTELKSMVEAPKGFKLVGADVDSQEAWIAGALGDSALGVCGSSALGSVTLIGDKATKTDIHNIAASGCDVSRDTAKNYLVYAALYGQGYKGTLDGLLKALPLAPESECEAKATKFLKSFKGDKSQYSGRYIGGLASEAFNAMEAIADSLLQETPVLKAKAPWSLRTKDFKTTRVNRVIQSSGVDFRDMLICLDQLYRDKLGVQGRLLMTIHDEIRNMVRADQTVLAAWSLQLAQLCCRAAFIDALALDCIPAGIAWFSGVDVDTVLRKDPEAPQVTPSQLEPIAPGECWAPKDLVQLLKVSELVTA
jgi:DNA polymerase gamma 1